MSTVEQYLQLMDKLRESRRSPRWKAEDDRPLLAFLEDLYAKLSEIEQECVEAQGWRGWPKEYDTRTMQDLEAVALDAADDGGDQRLPRHKAA